MTALNDRERDVLRLLAEEWQRSGPPGFLETIAIAGALGISVADARSTIRALFVKGLVGTDKVDIFAAYLTPEGFEKARK